MSFLKPKAAKSSSSESSQSTSSSLSDNVNNSLVKSTYAPVMQQGVDANGYLSSLLTGQGDTAAAQGGLNNYLQMAGYAPAMQQLSRGITGQGAASGLLNSGATLKALQSRGADLNQQFTGNYLQQLAGLSGLGMQAGGLVANTGQRSMSNSQSTGTSNSTSTGGRPSTLGSIMSAAGGIASIFSDRRIKRDIKLLSRDADGLGRYEFAYSWAPAKRLLGVMADEVARLRPHALGPTVLGLATVNYGKL